MKKKNVSRRRLARSERDNIKTNQSARYHTIPHITTSPPSPPPSPPSPPPHQTQRTKSSSPPARSQTPSGPLNLPSFPRRNELIPQHRPQKTPPRRRLRFDVRVDEDDLDRRVVFCARRARAPCGPSAEKVVVVVGPG